MFGINRVAGAGLERVGGGAPYQTYLRPSTLGGPQSGPALYPLKLWKKG